MKKKKTDLKKDINTNSNLYKKEVYNINKTKIDSFNQNNDNTKKFITNNRIKSIAKNKNTIPKRKLQKISINKMGIVFIEAFHIFG